MSAPISLTDTLGPGTQIQLLMTSARDYQLVRPKLDSLLTYPHLDLIALQRDGPVPDKDFDSDDLRSLVIDVGTRFVKLCNVDASLTRIVLSWSSVLNALIGVVDVASFVNNMEPISQSYAEYGRSQAGTYHLFFTDFIGYISLLGRGMEDATKRMESLDGEIATRSGAIAGANILQTLSSVLTEIYKLTPKESDVQIAGLLSLDVSTLGDTFGKLFTDNARFELVLISVRQLKLQIRDIRERLLVLQDILTKVVEISVSLADGVWAGVSERLKSVADVKVSPTARQIATIRDAWQHVAKDAAAFGAVIAGLPSGENNQGANLLDNIQVDIQSTTRLEEVRPYPAGVARAVWRYSVTQETLLPFVRPKDPSMGALNLPEFISINLRLIDEHYIAVKQALDHLEYRTPVWVIWSAVLQALQDNSAFYSILSGAAGSGIFATVRPKVIEIWWNAEQNLKAIMDDFP